MQQLGVRAIRPHLNQPRRKDSATLYGAPVGACVV